MRRAVTVMLIAFALIGLACSPPPPAGTSGLVHWKGSKYESEGRVVSVRVLTERQAGQIVGTAYERDTGEYFAGVELILETIQLGTRSDTSGMFRIMGIPAGTYRLRARYFAYKPVVIDSLDISEGRQIIVELRMAAAELDVYEDHILHEK